jgi:hypothetical protein
MPTLWFVKDGPVRDSWPGKGIQLLFPELRGAFGDYTRLTFSKNRPQYNVEEPSRYVRRVVIEVNEDGTDDKFSQAGFYLFLDLTPEDAHKLLADYRGKK